MLRRLAQRTGPVDGRPGIAERVGDETTGITQTTAANDVLEASGSGAIFAPGRGKPERQSAARGRPRLMGGIQAKLEIGEVNDPLEHEADRVADRVMRIPTSDLVIAAAPPRVFRKCAACETEETLQRKPTASPSTAGEAPALVHDVLRSSGQPLDPSSRAFFEPRFGQSLGHVRVHTDERAAASAQAIGARAYTLGSHIAFAGGRYQTTTQAGRLLLAHELAHTIQQQRGAIRRVQRVECSEYNNSSKEICEQQKCVTRDGADGRCRKTGMSVCACFPARMWREMLPSWVLALLTAAAIAAIAACFATGACEFAGAVAGLGAVAAAAVIAMLKAAGIRDTGRNAGASAAAASENSAPADAGPQEAPA